MSDDAEDFESINLASVAIDTRPLSLLGTVPESSDDGLDPHDFLTLNQNELVSESVLLDKNATDTTVPADEAIRSGSLLTSHLYESTLKDSMSPSLLQGDDLLHYDPENGWQTQQDNDQLLQFLLNQLEALKKEMRRDLKIHKDFIAEGSDCKQIREMIGNRFLQMSENYFSLNEIYNKESSLLRGFLQHIEKWDMKRSKILNRVRSIKSDKHNFGVKLADLLHKRNDIDAEIEELEDRLRVLRGNKAAVDTEIDEASSVLESKSAKYVNLFRELEKQGESVLSGFLFSSGLPQTDLQVLLKKKPVDAAFRFNGPDLDSKPLVAKKQSTQVSEGKQAPPSQPQKSTQKPPPPPLQAMGAQAFEVPEEEIPNYEEKTPYEKGFEKGNEQLAKVRETMSAFMESWFARKSEQKLRYKSVDDQLNTITDKIDLDPIVELLSHRIKAFEDLAVVSSKLSAELHNDGESWRSISSTLSSKEDKLLDLLSHSKAMNKEVKNVLHSSFTALKHEYDDRKGDQLTDRTTYLPILLYRELKAVASALDSIGGDPSYSSRISSVDSSVHEESLEMSTSVKPLLKFTMTNYGYRPTPTTVVDTITENAGGRNAETSKSPYERSTKDLKNE